MATEVNTFSAAVDDCIARSGRIDRRADIISYLRLSMRESQVLAFFSADLEEDVISSVTADPHIWTRPVVFRQMRSVQYPGLYDAQGVPIFPKFLEPGKIQQRHDHYYYESGDSFVFAGMANGASSLNTTINVAYYKYFNPLPYYEAGARPATYDLETLAWTYLTATTAAAQEAARALVTNWMLFKWYDMVLEGALAKLFKAIDDPRQQATYALYKQLQTSLLRGESRAAMGNHI